ncbi:MAG TPA: secretin N-terminal domain-containing protein [Pirellulales bacterium]|nr:secretin N-terminal domain-containing protein [Pirellulales bacterium]
MRSYRVLWGLALAGIFFLGGALDSAQAQPRFFGGGRGGRGRDMFIPPNAEQKPAEDKEKKDEKGDEKKDEEKKPEEKKDEGPPPVQHPLEPERPADPRELDVMPAEDGKISFSFKGQPWPSVLEWLADVCDMSLEWEEAPAGYLDFTTRGRYTVDEVRDLLNSVLLNKGFTVLRNGEVLIVANLKKLDASLVPRVTPSELGERGTYELVRTFFDLDWLIADDAAKEIGPLLSPFGKVTALKATNRLDVLDTAGNLLRIRELLAEEQSDSGQQRLVREFKLRYTRADEVLDTLNLLLGIEPKQQGGAAVDPRDLMRVMMMAQQGGGQPGMAQPGKKENNIFLAVNARENSILANAPPDKMGVIEQAIEAVDVPKARGRGIMGDAQKFKVYRLSGLQPDTLAKVLKDLGSLDPTTKLEVDTKKNALIVYGPLVDHLLVTDLVERLDGASRKFEVIQLRTLSAEYVAGSILTLMNGPEKQQDTSRPRWFYFDSSSQQQQQDSTDKFWVEADVERNRLLLRANEVELAEVRALLVKLGEIPADQRFGNTTRVVPAAAGAEMKDALERAKRLWQSVSPNPLEIEIDPSALRPQRRQTKPPDEATSGVRRAAPTEPREMGPAGSRDGRGGAPRQNQPRGNRSADRASPVNRFRLAQDRLEPKVDEDEQTQPEAADEPVPEAKDDNDPSPAAAETKEEAEQINDVPADEASNDNPETPDSAMEESDAVNEDSGVDSVEESPDAPVADAESELPTGPGELPRRAHAPIKITLGPQGLVISSSDTDALDRLEELLNNVMPARTNYEIFTLKHTYAKDMVTLLKDIFKADMSKDSTSRTEVFDMFWNGYRGSSNQQTRNTLSRRRPLNFVADPVTNTVLVQGADAAQLAEIEELIERYDRAEPPNSESVRRTTRVSLRYAKAKEVAEVVKDVYRDLLSPNDKALIAGQPQQQQPGRDQRGNDNFYSAMFSYLTDDPTKSEVVPRFKGMLSVGIDERANGVVISAPQIILTEVLKMVKDLDADARPSRAVVRVLKVRNPGVGTQVEQAVAAKKTPTPTAAETAPAPNGMIPNAGRSQGDRTQGGGMRSNGSR